MSRYKFSDIDFTDAVKSSFSIRDSLLKLGFSACGAAYSVFHSRVKKLNIDISHFTGQGHLKGKTHSWSKKLDIIKLLVSDSNRVLHVRDKQRLIEENYLINLCYKCGLKDTWQNELINLQIDHINGNRFDHRIENLRLLCPNCHSQTETFCGKNIKHHVKIRKIKYIPQEKKKCILCFNFVKNINSTYCLKCFNSNRCELRKYKTPTKINWPTIEELKVQLKTISYVQLGKKLGISDNAIRKHLKKNS